MKTSPIISVRLVTCPQRLLKAIMLQDLLLREGFAEVQVILDKDKDGAKANHLRALKAISKREDITHILIIEDDAQPVRDFREKVEEKVAAFPKDLISIYLGTGKPARYQHILNTLIKGDEPYNASISLNMLIHGVAYLAPARIQKLFTSNPSTAHDGADFHVGEVWYRATQRPIIYPVYSLVQHADDGVSIHSPNTYVLREARHLDLRSTQDGDTYNG